jgi:hypothetical protein
MPAQLNIPRRARIIMAGNKYGQQGAYLVGHNYFPKDKRDKNSIWASLCKTSTNCSMWQIDPNGDGTYTIVMAENGYNCQGWRLAAHRYFPSDSRNECSTFVNLSRASSNCTRWHISPVGDGSFQITMADNGYGNQGWKLAGHRALKKDARDKNSTFVSVHQWSDEDATWRFQPS